MTHSIVAGCSASQLSALAGAEKVLLNFPLYFASVTFLITVERGGIVCPSPYSNGLGWLPRTLLI